MVLESETVITKWYRQQLSKICYKVRQRFIASVSGITKCDRSLLQSALGTKKCDRSFLQSL